MQFSEEMKTFLKSHAPCMVGWKKGKRYAILKEHRDDWEDYTKKEN